MVYGDALFLGILRIKFSSIYWHKRLSPLGKIIIIIIII
jgi:hypothetical protein